MGITSHLITDKVLFQKQALIYFHNKKNIAFLNSNDDEKSNLLAISDKDTQIESKWQFGFISYDYKNKIEELSSSNFDGIRFPEKHFFTPDILFKIDDKVVEVSFQSLVYSKQNIKNIINEINTVIVGNESYNELKITPRISKEEYIKDINSLKEHIQLGDIYEVNFCQEFYAENVNIEPIQLYFKLNKKSPAPFSCFIKCDDKYLLSASPERFIRKKENKIVSQPIKGTIKRGDSEQEDEKLKNRLYNDPKEYSENVMIVDLVRNDLSKIAKINSVNVDELCGIFTFPQVHQMISTVSAEIRPNLYLDDIINATFPMGSMTGAPKVKAMQLIEKYERTKRGLYSGTVGYIDDAGNFDFNVVIRSILFNKENNYLSFIVGGAITSKSEPENEYEECLLKAKAMLEVLTS
jgi:para-aminobenzoate synthetase component 1